MKKMNKVLMVMVVAVILMFTVSIVMAGSGTLTWTDPTTRADGSAFNPATDALKHTLYYGLQSAITPTNYTTKVDLGATVTSMTLTTLPAGATTYAIVTITDKQNLESAASNIASKSIPQSKPGTCILQFN